MEVEVVVSEPGLRERVRAICDGVVGRRALTEPEGLGIARALGLGVPRLVVVDGAAEAAALDLAEFPGDRVVVKVMAAEIVHKSDLGGVAVVAKEPLALAAAIEAMARRIPAAEGFLIEEWVPHEGGLGGELLVGVREVAAFGPVVVLGPGGLDAELLGERAFPPLLLAPGLVDDGRLEALLAAHPFVRLLTSPRRGKPARVELAVVADLVRRLLALAATAAPAPLAELELNPVVATPRGLVALDAVARIGEAPPSAPVRPTARIDRLLHPRSVAVIGVSERMNPGRLVVENMLAAGFARERLWIVKPGVRELAGCPCVASLGELPAPVDLLVVAVAAEGVVELVEEAIDGRLAESILLLPGGLGETGESAARADRLRARLAASRATAWGGPVINGGNCLGFRSLPGHANTLFIPEHKLPLPSGPPAPVALIAQSGAWAIARLNRASRLNPRYVVTVGNQLDLTLGDYLAHLAGDQEILVFGCYVEGFLPGDGRRFLEAVARIRASGRLVVVYLAGRTRAGLAASASHTAAVAGNHRVAAALCEEAGALVAPTLEAFDDLVMLGWRLVGRAPGGRRLAAISNAGFECVAMADASEGFALAPFSPPTRAALRDLLARYRLDRVVDVHNPLDLTPMLGDEGFAAAAELCFADDGIDLGVLGCVPMTGALATLPAAAGHAEDLAAGGTVATRLAALWAATRKPWVAVVDAGALYDPFAERLAADGIPTFRTADRALERLRTWAAWALRS